ncbi:MAG: DUF489 family protein [Gammaproteobacteria bacterium]|nr:DUF489 family protein [Gammaproteobacteria bacterium]
MIDATCWRVIKLDRALQARPDVYRHLGAEIASIDETRIQQGEGDKVLDDTVVERLATAYEDHLSTIEPRIRVTGNRNHLQSPEQYSSHPGVAAGRRAFGGPVAPDRWPSLAILPCPRQADPRRIDGVLKREE